MHHLPPDDSPLRELFTVDDVVAIGTKKVEAPTIDQARYLAQRSFTADSRGALIRITFIALAANDDLILISIGRRGGIYHHWNFTKGTVR